MRKTLFFLLTLITAANVFAQTDNGYIKAPDGSEYKIFKSANGKKLSKGNFLEMHVTASYKDSMLFSSHQEGIPQYGLYDTTNFPIPFKQAFTDATIGDSIIIRIPTDSLIAKGQGAPFMGPGQYIYQAYSITNFYFTKEQVDSVQKIYVAALEVKEAAKAAVLAEKENKIIEAYLAGTNQKFIKTPLGVYMVITKEGTGNLISATDTAMVNYTGRTLQSKTIFDSDTDPEFGHVAPYPVIMAHPQVILGWVEAIKQMKKGTKATVFIPSPLGYGSHGNPPRIQPDEILMFDMEIANVLHVKAHTPIKKTTPVAKPNATKTIAKPKPAIKKTGN